MTAAQTRIQLGTLPPMPDTPRLSYTDRPSVAMLSRTQKLIGYGSGKVLPRGPGATLGQRVRAFFCDQPASRPLVGALPFDRKAHDYLVSPALSEQHLVVSSPGQLGEPRKWSLLEEPSAADYAHAVARAVALMAGVTTLRKVVLARSLMATSDKPVDGVALLQRLHAADPSVTAFLVPLPPEQDGTPHLLVGATPELLISRTGSNVISHPLAGSARRSRDAATDEAARVSLSASDKDRQEHALVAEFILDTLAPYCRTLASPNGTEIRSTSTMWHLGTRIVGQLRDADRSAADLAAILHPTPAVCRVPADEAAALLQALEPVARGFYAGAVGWCDRSGDGAWHVSIRCAEIAGCRARLYAGAGIISDSDPAVEVLETEAKFRTMLNALDVGV
jgi:isochorismate synthase